jgi:hypothetical protein
MALREGNSALQWAAIRPEDITPAVAVAVGHFVQVGQHPPTSRMALIPAQRAAWPPESDYAMRTP